MASKSLYLSSLIGADNKVAAESLSADIPLGTEDYSTANDLPATGNQVGDQAFVASTQRLYIWTGAGWYNIALINQTPTWDSGGQPEVEYELDSIGGTATSIILSATDPDGLPIEWTYSITDSGNDLATITNDSNGTFTITAKSLDDILNAGYDSEGGVFDITFRASDGVNLATALSTFTLSFSAALSFQGTSYGYISGASNGATIEKFSIASDGNSTTIGNMTLDTYKRVGATAVDAGFSAGDRSSPATATIDRFPFASDTNATNVGSTTTTRERLGFANTSVLTQYGYLSGGYYGPVWPQIVNTIEKYAFANTITSSNVGNLAESTRYSETQCSLDNGYSSGGWGTPGNNQYISLIQKFPFSADTNASSIGNLSNNRDPAAGASSLTDGYAMAGTSGGPAGSNYLDIQKFPFATSVTRSTVGSLYNQSRDGAGISGDTYGYLAGGYAPEAPYTGYYPLIVKFLYASEGTKAQVGSIAADSLDHAGHQI